MDQQLFRARFLGVLGGMGPMAGAAFMARLVALTQASSEQAHIPAILWNDSRVPDRPAGHAGSGPDPWPWMLNGLRHLEQAGAQAIAIPCNTAHLWHEHMVAATRLPVLHIVEAVADDLERKGIRRACIGLMGTATTLRLGLYQRVLEARGHTCVLLDDAEHKAFCVAPIALVKANRMEQACEPALKGAQLLAARGAQAVVLGCTELPLAIPHARRGEVGVPVSDSIDALALAAICWYEGRG